MPLTTTGADPKGSQDGHAIGVPMTDASTENEVWIYASVELLKTLGGIPYFASFQENRKRIEHIATCKHDTNEPLSNSGLLTVTLADWWDRSWPEEDEEEPDDEL